jgi:hypothetical protein
MKSAEACVQERENLQESFPYLQDLALSRNIKKGRF